MAKLSKVRVAILGASGYTGAELVRILAHHPQVELAVLTADRRAGKPLGDVFPHLSWVNAPPLQSLESVEWPGLDIDLVFCALPHGTTQKVIAGLLHEQKDGLAAELVAESSANLVAAVPGAVRVIDLSADFRLRNADTYKQWYGHAHAAPGLQKGAVYGITEFTRRLLPNTRLVANPGCYPTAAQLPLVPLLEKGLILPYDIIIDSKSGVSGAGRAEKEANLYSEVTEGLRPYGVASHRHAPEIEQGLSDASGEPVTVTFTPHLIPMSRGILSTKYVRLSDGVSAADLRQALIQRYDGERFVQVMPEGQVPSTHAVRGTNYCIMNVFQDRAPGRAIVISAIDNLVKGASGQAVQNMNVMFGLKEDEGLRQEALFP